MGLLSWIVGRPKEKRGGLETWRASDWPGDPGELVAGSSLRPREAEELSPQMVGMLPLLFRVYGALAKHIALHNAIAAPRFSLSELLSLPFTFRPFNYKGLQAKIRGVTAELDALGRETAVMDASACGPHEADTLHSLREYVAALHETACLLADLGQSLYRKTKHGRVTWREYRAMSRSYEASVLVSLQSGARLEAAMQAMALHFFSGKSAERSRAFVTRYAGERGGGALLFRRIRRPGEKADRLEIRLVPDRPGHAGELAQGLELRYSAGDKGLTGVVDRLLSGSTKSPLRICEAPAWSTFGKPQER